MLGTMQSGTYDYDTDDTASSESSWFQGLPRNGFYRITLRGWPCEAMPEGSAPRMDTKGHGLTAEHLEWIEETSLGGQ